MVSWGKIPLRARSFFSYLLFILESHQYSNNCLFPEVIQYSPQFVITSIISVVYCEAWVCYTSRQLWATNYLHGAGCTVNCHWFPSMNISLSVPHIQTYTYTHTYTYKNHNTMQTTTYTHSEQLSRTWGKEPKRFTHIATLNCWFKPLFIMSLKNTVQLWFSKTLLKTFFKGRCESGGGGGGLNPPWGPKAFLSVSKCPKSREQEPFIMSWKC